jgi:Uma2 family endonuclease
VKRDLYQSISSLQEYVLVFQEQALVEVYRRLETGVWEESVVVGLGASLRLESLDVSLPLERIYKWVEFPQN